MDPKVDRFIERNAKWGEEMGRLRAIALGCGLTENVKWGKPCYTLDGANVVLIMPLKESCVLAFFKGTLLKNPKGLLQQPGENTQGGRWLRFTNLKDLVKLEPTIKAYIKEAIEVEKAGLKVELKKTSEYKVPEEFQAMLDEDEELRTAFAALTPGRQRGYLLHFAAPKQSTTRISRVEKCRKQILAGKGLND